MTNTITDTKQGQSLTVSENKIAQNVQNKGNKMRKEIILKDKDFIEIRISKDTRVVINKVDNELSSVDIIHHRTELTDRIKLNNYEQNKNLGDDTSLSTCESQFSDYGKTHCIVTHKAFDK